MHFWNEWFGGAWTEGKRQHKRGGPATRARRLELELLEERTLLATGGGFTNAGLHGDYFRNATLAGTPSFSRPDVRLDFASSTQAPGGSTALSYSTVGASNWSARWSGQLIPRFSETYVLSAFAEDTFTLQIKKTTDTIWTTVINQTAFTGSATAGAFTFTAGTTYDVQAAFTHTTGPWAVQLHWSSPSTPDEAIEPFSVAAINAVTYNDGTYTDAMKMGRPYWEDNVPQDANGWPLADATNVPWEGANSAEKAGTYLLRFRGQADVGAQVFGPATFQVGSTTYNDTLPSGVGYDAATNITTATLTLTSDNAGILYLTFQNSRRTAASALHTGVTNVQLMKPTAPGAATYYSPDTLFDPNLESAYSRFTTERWLTANFDTTQVNWSDRTPPGFFKAALGDRGEVWEYEVMLANETGKDLYITIPINASADYVTKLANLLCYGSDGVNPYTSPQANPVYPGLNGNLRVYVEWSNEVWNWAFDQAGAGVTAAQQAVHNNTAEGQIINFDGTAPDGDFRRWAALKTVEASNTFRAVWGDAAMGDKVRMLLEYQYDNYQGTADEAFHFIDSYFNNGDGQQHVATPHPVNYFLWGAGGAVYYSSPNADGTQTAVTVPDAGFEAAHVAAGTAAVAPAGTPWTFTGNAGIYHDTVHPPAATAQALGTVTSAANDQVAGYRFTVGAADLVVYALGRWVTAGNGGTHTVHLFSASDNSEIASVVVDTAGAAAGHYVYANLPFPMTLAAHTAYYLVCDEWAGGDRYYDQSTTVNISAGFTINNAVRGAWNGGTMTFTAGTAGNHAYGPVDLRVGTAAIGALGFPSDPLEGSQAAFLGDTGTASVTINFPTTGVFALNLTAANKDGNENAIRLYLDGAEITPNGDDYRPQHAPWIPGQYLFGLDDRAYNTFGTAPFTISTPGSHTLRIVGTGAAGTYTYLDDFQVTSLDALFNAGIPGNGQANGQPQQALAAYQDQLNSQAKYAETFGLHVVAYEGGWSVGGDNGATPLQNYAKFVDPRAEQANLVSLDDFTRSGGALYGFGTYSQWSDTANSDASPLIQGVIARNQALPAKATNGTPVPGNLNVAQPTWDFNNAGGALGASGWISWNIVAPATGAYQFTATTSGAGGTVLLLVDGTAVASGASGTSLTGTRALTMGLHAVMVKAAAGSFSVGGVSVTTSATMPAQAPSGLGFTAQSDPTQALLSWTVNGSGVTGLRLERATDAGFTQNLTAFALAANATSYTDTGLTATTTYYYRIKAQSAGGDSAYSNTAVRTGVPQAPSGLGVTVQSDPTQAQLNWTVNGSGVTGLRLERATDAGFTQNLTAFALAANATSYTDTGLTATTTYYYRVKAQSAGGDSAYSDTAVRTGVPPAPSGLGITAQNDPTQALLNWTVNGSNVTDLRLERATDAGFTQNLTAFALAAGATSYDDTGLDPLTTYYYRIKALSATGDSAYSNTAVRPATQPSVGPLLYTAPSGNGADALLLRRNGTALELLDNGSVVLSRPLANTTGAVITGADGESDSLTIDNSAGLIALHDGLRFDGGAGGGNALRLLGTSAADTLLLTPTYANLNAAQTVVIVNVQAVTAVGGAGAAAYLFAGPGDATLSATPAGVALSGPGYSLSAGGFPTVSAFAGTGNNAAYLSDGPGNDLFVSTPSYSYLRVGGSLNIVSGFQSVRATSSGGSDLALLFDSPGNDTFVSTPTWSYLKGSGYVNLVAGFAEVRAFSSGGADAAFLYDSAGDDLFRSTPAYSFLAGSGFLNLVVGFAQVTAIAGAGGSDTADLYDSPGNDTFTGQGSTGTLTTPTATVTVAHFALVRAGSRAGGTDHLSLGAIDYLFQQYGNWQ
jgi:hypothetical protein